MLYWPDSFVATLILGSDRKVLSIVPLRFNLIWKRCLSRRFWGSQNFCSWLMKTDCKHLFVDKRFSHFYLGLRSDTYLNWFWKIKGRNFYQKQKVSDSYCPQTNVNIIRISTSCKMYFTVMNCHYPSCYCQHKYLMKTFFTSSSKLNQTRCKHASYSILKRPKLMLLNTPWKLVSSAKSMAFVICMKLLLKPWYQMIISDHTQTIILTLCFSLMGTDSDSIARPTFFSPLLTPWRKNKKENT